MVVSPLVPLERLSCLREGVRGPVLVSDEMRKCVAFVYCKIEGELRPKGTAFWIAYPVPRHPETHLGVLVTANHVIAGIKATSDDDKVYLRVNLREGGSDWHESQTKAWEQPDPSVDVAVCPWFYDKKFDHSAWPAERFAIDEVIEREGMGIGDEVFTVGLFRNHLGKDRIEPILRVGNIAAIPADPVYSKKYGHMKAILIEARSIGGLSGSPVFVHMGYARWREGQMMQAGTKWPFEFLGVMHGHWEVTEQEADDLKDDELAEKIHTGISIVIPAELVLHNAIDPIMGGLAEMRANESDQDHGAVADDLTEDGLGATGDLLGKLFQVPKDEANEVHRQHDQP